MKKIMLIIIIFGIVFLGKDVYTEDNFEAFKYDDQGRRDPFWPLVSANGTIISYSNELTPNDLMLEGILGGGNGFLAIINGRVIKQGDYVGAYKVEVITDREVIIFNKNKEYKLRLKSSEKQ